MKLVILTIFIFCSSLLYSQETNKTDINTYKLINQVIKKEGLNHKFGLELKPYNRLSHINSDSLFLSEFLISKKDSQNYISSFPEKPKVLSPQDIDTIMKQRKKSFPNWDNSKLRFNLSNKKHFYSISHPVYNLNKSIALVRIDYHCPGLCGTDKIYMLIKKQGVWEVHIISSAIH